MNVNVLLLLLFCLRNLLIVGFKSVYGTERTSRLRCGADLAAKSALSFPLTLMWLGIQHKIIFLWLDSESSLVSSLTINGFSSFLFFSDVKTESESENIIHLLCLSLEMMLRAKSMLKRTLIEKIQSHTWCHQMEVKPETNKNNSKKSTKSRISTIDTETIFEIN